MQKLDKKSWLIITAVLIIGACSSLKFIPESKMNAMGSQAYSEIQKKEKINRDPHLNEVLLRVGKRIAAVAEAKHHVGYDWKFTLIQSKEMNAFCLPGGKVAFYTGILPIVQNEAAMAIVMGHEVAHATLQHGNQRVSQSLLIQLGLTATDITLNNNKYRGLILGGLGLGAQVGVMLPFSRGHESEADVFGMEYAAKAGYDPREAARFWERFSRATSGGSPPEFLSTHPASSNRIKKLRSLEKKALSWYQNSPQYGLGASLK